MRPEIIEDLIRAVVQANTGREGKVEPVEKQLFDAAQHTIEKPWVTAGGDISVYITVVHMSRDTSSSTNTYNLKDTAVSGVIGNGALSGTSGSAIQTTTIGYAPEQLEQLLKPFESVLANCALSPAKQGLIKSQLEILREEGTKKPEEQDKDSVKRALKDVEAAAATVTALKGVWDTFGGPLLSWFGVT